jgi:hypothetical protein
MRKILSVVLAACAMLAGPASVSAADTDADPNAIIVPIAVTGENRDGRQLVTELYSLPVPADPGALIKEPFERDGFLYAFESITKEEKTHEESKTHSETVTVETATGDLAAVLGALAPTLPYDDGEYSGVPALDHTSVRTEAAAYATKSYTVSETKSIDGLDRNDPGYVPKTTVKDGRTLTLANIEWSVGGAGLADGALTPSLYTATATYTAGASSRYATGYVTVATYSGEVVSAGTDSVLYTVTYAGRPIGFLPGGKKAAALVAAAMLLIAALLAVCLLFFRRNTRIYTPDAGGAEYELIGRCRLRAGNPYIDLRRLGKYPRDEAVIEIEKRTARRMFGRIVRIGTHDGTHTHLIESTENDNYWFTVPAEREEEVSK